jgi:hypothetical protein
VFGRKRLHERVNTPQGLVEAFSRIRQELTPAERGDRPSLRVRCVGDRKPFDPYIEEEICEIGREALLNLAARSR